MKGFWVLGWDVAAICASIFGNGKAVSGESRLIGL